MFSIHSSVTQLKPEAITKCLKDSEERHWSVGDLANLSGQGSHEGSDQDLGSVLLSQSTCLSKIHSYFSQLESRKCCLHLACRRSTFNSMRVLPTSVPADDGSSKNKQPAISINILDNKSLRTFKHAYLCAVYPVLAAPDPPTTPSPEMQDSLRFIASETFRGSISRNFPESIPPSRSRSRSVTPYSLHDSGVEESDETGFIPMESICEQLQRAFGLSKAVFRQYEALLVKAYAKKSSQMLLAEELSGQLILLETNSHPFYSPSHFITQNGYDLWQKQERNHISELLNKFWQLSLPFPGYSHDLISELSTIHEDYHVLLTKLLDYERQFRQEDENSANTTGFTPLSSASSRLLLEFGMRYGIGELYRKVSLLHCLNSEFCSSVGHLTYMNSLVASIQHMLPSNKTSLVMVKQELDILHSSLQVLKAQTCKALSQMKYLFPGNRPIEGLECLLSLLQTVLSLMNYLAPSNNPKECLDTYVRHTIQNIFRPTYEMFKTVALEDLSQGRTEEMDLRLLSVLIEDIREDVSDYKNNFDGSFMQFCHVSQMAASSFYEFLMEDVEWFTGYHTRHQTSPVIELQLVAIMYRLNKLDEDWKLYILPQQQTWRRYFLPCLFQWCQVLQTHMQNFVVEAVSHDVFISQRVDVPHPLLTSQTMSIASDRKSCTFSVTSLSPSVNSAFSSIISLVRSTPHLVSTQECEEPVFTHDSAPLESSDSVLYVKSKQKPKYDSVSLNLDMVESSGNVFKISNYSKSSLPENLNCIGKYEQNVHQFGPLQDNMQSFGRNGQQSGSRISVVSPSTSEYNEDGVSNDSEDEVFQYPPLKIISKKPKVSSMDGVSQNSNYVPTDLSKPVFSAPFFDECLNQREPPGTNISNSLYFGSSAVSLQAPATQTRPGFTCSADSQTSFLLPAETVQAILPVSKSVMDLLVILQRICGFSNSLVTAVFNFGLTPSSGQTSRQLSTDPLEREEKTSRRRNSASTKRDVVGSQATATSKKIESNGLTSSNTDGNFIPIKKSNLLPCSSLSGKRLTCATLISVSSCEDAVNDGKDVGVTGSDVGAPGSDVGAPGSDVGAPSNGVGASGNESCDPKLQFNRYKCLIHLHLQKTMCHLLTTYSINMLCMDLCATPKNASRRLIGQKLIEAIDIYQKAGLVWSCRHQVEKTHPCLYYHKRNAQYLSERHEPITQHMCTRINNVSACLHALEVYHVKLKEVMAVDSCPPPDGANCGQNSSIPVFKNGYWPESLNDEESLHDLKTSSDPQLHSYWFQESLQVKEMTRQHLMSVLCGMCRLLAFKLNLFVRDALPLVLSQKDAHSPIAERLAPVTTFLQKHLDSFSTWLYPDCFRRVLENIWVYIVQDIESHAAELLRCEPPSSPQAQMWMLVISHFMTFMNNGGKGINRDLLLSQASYVLLELELHTLSTVHLVALCQSLREYSTEGDNPSWENVDTKRPPAIIHKIFKELQSLRKCFSGAELVKWILKNRDALPADMVLPSEPLTKESATAICQSLLDQNFIVDLDTEFLNSRSSPSYSRDGVSPYPELSLHSTGTDWEYRNSRGGVSPSDQDSLSDASVRSFSVTPTQEVDAVSPSVTPTQDVNAMSPSVSPTQDVNPMSPSVSPTQDVNTMSPSVTPTLDVDQVSHYVSSKQDVIEGVPCNLTQTQEQNERVIRNGNHVDSGTTQIPPKLRRRRSTEVMCEVDTAFQKAIYKSLAHPQDTGNITTQDGLTTSSMANDHYSMDQMRRFSTFASLSEITNGSGKFMADAETFYLVHHSFQLQGFDIAGHYTNQWNFPVSEYDHQLHRARVSSENLALVERCFMHKVSPLTILAIISGRKKTDSLAKVFIKQLPQSTLDRINILLDEPGGNCTSS